MKQSDLHNMLKELLDVEEGLTDWEINFIESLERWEGNFTPAQAAALEKAWNKHFNVK